MALTPEAATRLRAELASELTELTRVATEVQTLAPDRDNKATYALALLLMNYYTGAEHLQAHCGSARRNAPSE